MCLLECKAVPGLNYKWWVGERPRHLIKILLNTSSAKLICTFTCKGTLSNDFGVDGKPQNPRNTQLGLASIYSGVFRSLWLCLSFGKYLSLILSPWVLVERWDAPPPLFSRATLSKARPHSSLKEGEKECVHKTLQGDSVLVLGLEMLIRGDVCPLQLLRG